MIVYDPDSPTPAFEQIRSQIAAAAASGALAPGTRLPSVRRLAADLDIAPNTVARAYRELEQSGVVVTRGRGGTVVADASAAPAARAHAFVAEMRSLGVPRATILGLVEDALSTPATMHR
ncbi:GntR family transcriptional regulator [Tsukamurella paurometabola]|uniref:Uncharacterized HTH-type transcriptional regulator ydcR n=1 Tax=Tsukamurella paurometabola TaxID=2061 RepID=A0A3P8L3U1_TSUPA|nr:GntR family transcriptional regulator [Tsukamurella paurometabola]UEA82832.1 GntR family transcriptional regulator [Tsukamurella paurometabola]VDR39905.1 Uncharacterized HTH-type transcriptional regulator ydcR [Tsukamurella paurometabola]